MFKIFVFLSKRRISGGVNWSLPFQFLLFRKLPITPRKSFLNSQRIIPKIQVFQFVIFKRNIQFFVCGNSCLKLSTFRPEISRLLSVHSFYYFEKCPSPRESFVNSQRIISERQVVYRKFSSKISTFCLWKFEVSNYPLFREKYPDSKMSIFSAPRESFQRKPSSKLNSQGMIFGRMTLRKITRFG